MYAVFSRKVLQIVSFVLLLCVAFFAEAVLISDATKSYDMREPAVRISFLSDLGLEVDESTLSQTDIMIPSDFSDVYQNYNLLQIEAGYDLSEYKGKKVTKYTYQVTNYNDEHVNVNMLCYSGKVIGGDISSTALDGFMLPLK